MAKTYKELMDRMAHRGINTVAQSAASAVDTITKAPVRTVEAAQNIKHTMTTKMEVLSTTIEAKLLMEEHLLGQVEDDAFAYELAQNENLRKTMNQLAQQILQPTPVEQNPFEHGNRYINLGAGLSTFWAEMQKKVPIEVEDAAKIENILMSINAGMDKELEPDTRKLFFRKAGMAAEQVEEFVPLSDYVTFENNLKDQMRDEVMEELGISGREPSEEEQLLIDSMAEDRMFGMKLAADTSGTAEDYEPTYEDTYGISAQDMYEMFADDDAPEITDGDNVKLDDPSWHESMESYHAEDAYFEMLGNSVAENMEELAMLEAEAIAMNSDLALSDADLNFVPTPEITDADFAFAAELQDTDLDIDEAGPYFSQI